jgi:thymidine kinase
VVSAREFEMSCSKPASESTSANGTIKLILGCMFSGKTKEFDRLLHLYEIPSRFGKRWTVISIKYLNDQRYEAKDKGQPVELSNGRKCLVISNDLTIKRDSRGYATMKDAYDDIKQFDVIGIDEGQFFPDIVEYAERLANEGRIVIISALSGKFDRTPFGRVLELIPKAESLTMLSAKCVRCGGDAHFTARMDKSNKSDVQIGGSESYEPMCRNCHNEYSKSTTTQ